jgi:hypothetical protein
MATTSNKTAATPHKIVATDHENLTLSRDAFILKYRKKAEIEAKLEAQRLELEAAAEAEIAALEKAGNEDNAVQGKTRTNEEV